MNLYVMPISGSYFPHQLAMLEWLAEAGAAPPSLVLGSSGGNIAAYVGMAGGWAKQGMRVLYTELYARDVWQSWWPVYLPLPSIPQGLLQGQHVPDEPEVQVGVPPLRSPRRNPPCRRRSGRAPSTRRAA